MTRINIVVVKSGIFQSPVTKYCPRKTVRLINSKYIRQKTKGQIHFQMIFLSPTRKESTSVAAGKIIQMNPKLNATIPS